MQHVTGSDPIRLDGEGNWTACATQRSVAPLRKLSMGRAYPSYEVPQNTALSCPPEAPRVPFHL